MREKALQRLATKGVVRLFNAIAKAQKQLREAEEATGNRAKAVKLGKASFLAQLKGSAAAAGGAADQPLVPSGPRQAIPGVAAGAAAAAAAGGSKRQQQRGAAAADSSSDDEDAAGWEVLQKGFVGLQGAQSPAAFHATACCCLGCCLVVQLCLEPAELILCCCWRRSLGACLMAACKTARTAFAQAEAR